MGAAAAAPGTAQSSSRIPPDPGLSLGDGGCFRLKSRWELVRGLLVFWLCSSPRLVQSLLSASRWVLGRRLWGSLLRLTLYGQFVAGETTQEIEATLQRLRVLGVRPLLAVPIEEDVGPLLALPPREGWYEGNTRSILACLDLSARGGRNPMMQLKVTALMGAQLCVSIGAVGPRLRGEPRDENQHLWESLRRLNSVAERAVERGVRVLVDAEYTYVNPALSLVTLAMMVAWNRERPWVWNTYQAYLKDSFERLPYDAALAESLGVCFGVKLVRGAYLDKEKILARNGGYPVPVHPNWEATNESYQRCLDFALGKAAESGGRFELIVATHNEESVTHAVERMAQLGIVRDSGPVSFGQLLGMCDQVSLALGQAGYSIYKSIPYGPVEDVIPYLVRRAQENRSVLQGIRKERDLLRQELRRRLLRRP
uniref:Proline dehydrogenase n=1 Tax=Sphenodon punctatus TaxID=8508 RepID=A0A8D0HG10_SPHPU